MSKNYDSNYTDKKITAAQYIAEVCCERKAKKEGKKLPQNFWNLSEWKVFFLRQHTLANKLLKMYGEAATIQGIGRKEVKWAYSLNLPAIAKAIESIAKIQKDEVIEEVQSVEIRTETKQKSLLDLI